MVLLAAGILLASGPVKTALFMAFALVGVGVAAAVWPELLAMAFLFAGRYSYEARLAPFDAPLSLNQFMLVGLAGVALVNARYLVRALRRWSILCLLLLGVALVLGLGWSHGLNYGVYKVARTWLVVIPGILIAATVVERRRSLAPLILAVFVVGFALNSVALLTFDESMEGRRLSGLGSGPITFARAVGLSLIIGLLSVVWYVQRARETWGRVMLGVSLIAVASLLPGFVLAQSRGPAIAVFVAIAVVLTLSLYGNWRVVIAALGLGGVLVWSSTRILQATFDSTRFDLTSNSNQVSVDARVTFIWESLDLVTAHPLLGVGTGGWPVELYGIDDRLYPHNFLFEIASENGLPVAAMVVALFALVTVKALAAWFRSPDPQGRFVVVGCLASLAFFLVNVSATGDSVDNRLLWVTLVALEYSAVLAGEAVRVRVVRRRALGTAPTLPAH